MGLCTSSVTASSFRTAAVVLALMTVAFQTQRLDGAPQEIRFSQSSRSVETYDFVEITLNVREPDARNPFTNAAVDGWFAAEGGEKMRVDGFCDSGDGSIFRIRFMPSEPGRHDYSVTYRQDAYEVAHKGNFSARDGWRKGIVRVAPEYPWHFLWEGTGEHYFYNGTTTYFLAGWDEKQIRQNLDRLARLKVNRVRAAIEGRVKNAQIWTEHVYPTDRFSFLLNPWVAQRPDSVEDPGFDVTRFNVDYWRKWDSLLRHARQLDMVVSVIFYVDGRRPGVDPFGKKHMGGTDEQRYYRYAVARFGAFSNVMWDVTNEYHLFRDEAWVDKMGTFIKTCDPYDHLTSIHGHGDFPFRTSPSADFAMYQSWDEGGGYAFMRSNRKKQAATGRIIPQVNEEYGYENHANSVFPHHAFRCADNRRRLAWGMYMAGCYQTTGERADTGTGWGPDTGGGWVNGRGDDSMTMFLGYGYTVDFFTSIPWWQLNPDNRFFTVLGKTLVQKNLTHVVYTRDRAGRATFYINGWKQADRTVSGNCSNWDTDYRLALANELTRDRPWLGEIYRIAIYDRALGEQHIAGSFKAGQDKAPGKPIVLYDFHRGQGETVEDVSGVGEPLNAKIGNTAAVRWLPSGGLGINDPVLIASVEPAAKITNAVRKTHEITIEAWIKPDSATQTGPARIVTVSKDSHQRNFTLGQKGGVYDMRFRTTSTSLNGEPALSSFGGEQVCGLRGEKGDVAVIYLPAGGSVAIKALSLSEHLQAKWYNPRSGQWTSAAATAKNTYTAPDKEDWVLLLQKDK